MGRDELLAALPGAAASAFGKSRVFLAYAHGSRVDGQARPESDLDIGYYVEGDPLALRQELALIDELSRQLDVVVDLRDLGPAPIEVRGRVLETGVRIFCRDDVARVHLERDLLGRYHDQKVCLHRFHSDRMRSIARTGL